MMASLNLGNILAHVSSMGIRLKSVHALKIQDTKLKRKHYCPGTDESCNMHLSTTTCTIITMIQTKNDTLYLVTPPVIGTIAISMSFNAGTPFWELRDDCL